MLDVDWLNRVLSKVEWQRGLASVNAAARAAAVTIGNTLGEDEAAAAAALDKEATIPATLAHGRELVLFLHQPGCLSDTSAHRIFVWWEDGALSNSDTLGALYLNEYGPERVRSADNCFRMADLEAGQGRGKFTSAFRGSAARPFPSNACFGLLNKRNLPDLAVAAESAQAMVEWLTALSFAENGDRISARMRQAIRKRRQQLEDATATAQRQNETAAARVQQLNGHYDQAGRGAQVKWFFHPTAAAATAASECSIFRRVPAAAAVSSGRGARRRAE